MENLGNIIFFNKLLSKNFKKGLKYKFFKYFLNIFKIIFLIKRQYEFNLVHLNYIFSFNYDLQINLPLFTKKKKIGIRPLFKKKKTIEVLKWISVIFQRNKFRSIIFRISFFLLSLFLSSKYNILKIIHLNVLKKLNKFYLKKKYKKNRYRYLGAVTNIKLC